MAMAETLPSKYQDISGHLKTKFSMVRMVGLYIFILAHTARMRWNIECDTI